MRLETNLLLSSFLFSVFSRYLRCPNNLSLLISQRRNGYGYIQQSAVFASANRFIVFQGFAGGDLPNDFRLLKQAVFRNYQSDRFTDSLFSFVTEHLFRPGVPAQDNPIQIFTDNCIVR